MAHESFDDASVAAELNSKYVSIKVDRETRPDVDAHYMTALLAINGSGGWPLSAFLTPDGEVIYTGTYFPRTAFLRIIDHIASLWDDEPDAVVASAQHISAQLARISRPETVDQTLPPLGTVRDAAVQVMGQYDREQGGFSRAPKFPSVSNTHSVLHTYAALVRSGSLRSKDEEVADWAQAMHPDKVVTASAHTLARMFRGGLSDVLAGGQARYSVTRDWAVPHWEKMLYDQGQNLGAYAEAIRLAGDKGHDAHAFVPELRAAARAIVHYLATVMVQPAGSGPHGAYGAGGLYASEDADSLPSVDAPKAQEGAFYLWDYTDLAETVGWESDAWVFAREHWSLKMGGNIDSSTDPHGEMAGKNVLHSAATLDETAAALGWDRARVVSAMGEVRLKLAAVQAQRPRPGLDDKIVAAWNGYAISGLAKAAAVLDPIAGEPAIPTAGQDVTGSRALKLAEEALQFIMTHLYDRASGQLRRSWRQGQPGPWGFAIDYASLVAAHLDLYQATGKAAYVDEAIALQATLDRLFFDDEAGGWFISPAAEASAAAADSSSSEVAAPLPTAEGTIDLPRGKDDDGAEPSATSLASANLVRLLALVDTPALRSQWDDRLSLTVRGQARILDRYPRAAGTLAAARTVWGLPHSTLVIVGSAGDATVQSMLREARQAPASLVASIIHIDPNEGETTGLARHNSLVASLRDAPLESVAHVCSGFVCGLPVRTLGAWQDELARF